MGSEMNLNLMSSNMPFQNAVLAPGILNSDEHISKNIDRGGEVGGWGEGREAEKEEGREAGDGLSGLQAKAECLYVTPLVNPLGWQ